MIGTTAIGDISYQVYDGKILPEMSFEPINQAPKLLISLVA